MFLAWKSVRFGTGGSVVHVGSTYKTVASCPWSWRCGELGAKVSWGSACELGGSAHRKSRPPVTFVASAGRQGPGWVGVLGVLRGRYLIQEWHPSVISSMQPGNADFRDNFTQGMKELAPCNRYTTDTQESGRVSGAMFAEWRGGGGSAESQT